MSEVAAEYDYYEGWPEEMKQDHEMYYNLFNPEMGEPVIENLERAQLREIKPVMDDLVQTITLGQKQKLNNLLSWISAVTLETRMFTEDMAFKAGWYLARGDLTSIKRLRDNRVYDFGTRYKESVTNYIDQREGGSYIDAHLYSEIGYFFDDENPGGAESRAC